MKLKLAVVVLALCSASAMAAVQLPPLKNPAVLNIGFVCRWDERCIGRQKNAMRHALKYVAKSPPPAWKIQLCNRNAGRNGTRVDWVGFHNCVRNTELRPPARTRKRRS